MPTFLTENSIQPRRQIFKRTLAQRVELSITAVFFVILVVTCILSLLFLSHSNRVATKGHRIVQLRAERDRLITANEVLNMKIADLQSLQNLENDPRILSMVDAADPKFVRGDTAIAKKED